MIQTWMARLSLGEAGTVLLIVAFQTVLGTVPEDVERSF